MRRIIIIFALFVFAFTLAGCKKKSDEIELLIFAQPHEQEIYQQVLDAFEEEYGVKVNMSVVNDEYYQTINSNILANTLPDVFYVRPGDVRAYVNSGILTDLTSYIESEENINIDDLWDIGVESYQYNGEVLGEGSIYALPKDISAFALAYNKTAVETYKDEFEAKNIPLPSADYSYTWSEFVEANKILTRDRNNDGALDIWGTGLFEQHALHSFIWGAGGDWLNADATKVTVNTPEFKKGFNNFLSLQFVHGVTQSSEDFAAMDHYKRWLNGQLGFFPAGTWDVGYFDKLNFEYDIMPWPRMDDNENSSWYAYIGTIGYGLASNSDNKDMAAKLIMYLSANQSAQEKIYRAGIQLPNVQSIAENEYLQDEAMTPGNREVFIDIIKEHGKPYPNTRAYTTEWFDTFFNEIDLVWSEEMSGDEYLAYIQPKMQEKLDQAIQQEEMDKPQ